MKSVAARWIAVGALFGALGVAFGAFGAHGLGRFLQGLGYEGDDLSRRLAIFETAVDYQLLHALALVITGISLQHRDCRCWRFAAWAFVVGILLFSGLLKVLTVAGPQWNWFGRIVPIGGASMIVGWTALAVGALRQMRQE